jgi:hypothetical protein
MKLLIEKIGERTIVELKEPGPNLAGMLLAAMVKYPNVAQVVGAAHMAYMDGKISSKVFDLLKTELGICEEKIG